MPFYRLCVLDEKSAIGDVDLQRHVDDEAAKKAAERLCRERHHAVEVRLDGRLVVRIEPIRP